MLITLKEILGIAEERKCAVGAFNTPNLECLTAVLQAAEELELPVIISHAEVHEPVSPMRIIGPIMVEAAKKAPVPVCVHLDHCETLSYMEEALRMGFTGVMYDGSSLPYEENAENTRRAVALAARYGANVEAELGHVGAAESSDHSTPSGPVYTDPALAERFSNETGIDALAPSFGTAHGIYKSKPVLDLTLVREIAERTDLPLVMHGGSGVSEEDYRKAIQSGIRKINYYTYMAKAGTEAVKAMLQEDVTYFHDLALAAEKAMREDAKRAMRVFAGL